MDIRATESELVAARDSVLPQSPDFTDQPKEQKLRILNWEKNCFEMTIISKMSTVTNSRKECSIDPGSDVMESV